RLHAQEERPLRRREIEQTGAASLRDAIAAARPHWLLLGGDTTDAASAAQVLVFVDDGEAGDLRALAPIAAARVQSVTVRSGILARQRNPRLAHRQFAAAIYVSTIVVRDPGGPRRRLSVSVNGGMGIQGQASQVRAEFNHRGYRSVLPPFQAWAREGEPSPMTYGGVVHYAVRGDLGAELEVQHTPEAFFGGIRPAEQPVVSGFFTTSEAALMATWSRTAARAGIGVAYRTTSWELARAYCQCEENESSSTSAFGLAGGVALQLPADAAWFVQLRGQARYFPSHPSPDYAGPGSMNVGGLTVYSGIGLGFRL
ncbi:MAG TPA: hypothetical protein VFY65_18270, partial [Longimicrobium sp.]|nr:hypothetical protein [Longimicrobium sp.]